MHVPKYFQITDTQIIDHFIRETGFATLISKGSAYPIGTHIPIELEINEKGEKVLWGHMSKANPQWMDFKHNENVLVIFLSPVQRYISSSWYNHPNAPTWNYLSVHITGKINIIEGEKLVESIKRLTDRYEQASEHPVSFDTLPESVKKQMTGLVGFEINIDDVQAAFKLSQNRNEEDFNNIIKQLRLSNELSSILMADIMERQRDIKLSV